MARPSTINGERIIAAARELFLEKGIRVTTFEVAKRAGVAEGSIFNHFKTKLDLFRAAMQPQLDEPAWVTTLQRHVNTGDLRATLLLTGLQIVDFFRSLLPLMMMSWSNPSPKSDIPDIFSEPNPPPLRAFRQVVRFFDAEMRKGRLRRSNPEVIARCFLGGLQNYVFFELLLRAHNEQPMPTEDYVKELVDLIWNGAKPRLRKR